MAESSTSEKGVIDKIKGLFPRKNTQVIPETVTSAAIDTPPGEVQKQPNSTSEFSPETQRALETAGYTIYPLTGKSIDDLARARKAFADRGIRTAIDFTVTSLKSRKGQVAIKPYNDLVEGTRNKGFVEQDDMVRRQSEEVAQQIPGTEVVIGEAPDYCELDLLYFDRTGRHLIPPRSYVTDDDSVRTRTRNPKKPGDLITVGLNRPYTDFAGERGGITRQIPALITLSSGSSAEKSHDTRVIPLVVPKGS